MWQIVLSVWDIMTFVVVFGFMFLVYIQVYEIREQRRKIHELEIIAERDRIESENEQVRLRKERLSNNLKTGINSVIQVVSNDEVRSVMNSFGISLPEFIRQEPKQEDPLVSFFSRMSQVYLKSLTKQDRDKQGLNALKQETKSKPLSCVTI